MVISRCVCEPAGYQQQRMAGNLPVKPNKYVEAWSTNREHIELTYKWDKVLAASMLWTSNQICLQLLSTLCMLSELALLNMSSAWPQDTVLSLVKWVVAFPVVLYTITKWEYAKSDRMFGREERKFL